MKRTDSQPTIREIDPETAPRAAARQQAWVLEAVRHLFVEAMADRRR